MKTVGIIAEYNPFHRGHALQLEEIRRVYGRDTRIIAVMSGNYTQRGDIAVADKYTRAAAAAESGVNLVLELPFPFSGESAPVFATAGVHILGALGVVDVLSFGSESGDIELCLRAARATADPALHRIVRETEKHEKDGFPAVYARTVSALYGEEIAAFLLSPNNLLGAEYIRAASKAGLPFDFHTVRRVGSPHDAEADVTNASDILSAAALRKIIHENGCESVLPYLPQSTHSIFRKAIAAGIFPMNAEALSPAVLSYFAINTPDPDADFADAGGGLYNRLFSQAEKATDIHSFLRSAATKKYTAARIRRALRNILLGVTSSELKTLPRYTTVLAADPIGRTLLRDIQKRQAFPLLTKPADYRQLPEEAARQAAKAMRADSLCTLCFPQIRSRDYFFHCAPYRKSANTPDENLSSSFVEAIDSTRP